MALPVAQKIETPKRWRAWDTSSSNQDIGQERVTNGDFANWTSTDPDNWIIVNQDSNNTITESAGGGAAVYVSDNSKDLYINQANIFEVGKKYRFRMDCTAHTSGSVNLHHRTADNESKSEATISGVGSIDHVFTATETTLTISQTGESVNLTFDNVSVKEVESFGNNNHGQIYSGRGLEFDGVGDRITFTEQSYADNTPWTIACWAYFDSLSATEFITGEDGNTRPHIGVTGAGVPVFRANYGTGESANSHFEFGTQGLEDKTWYRIVWTATGASSTINCYLNGVLTGSINSGTTSNSGSGTLAALTGGGSNFNWNNIGSPYESGGNRGHGVDGKLSDFQSWNATWTAEDAAFDYANPEQLALNRGGTSLTESNLKIWYPMNDGHRGQQSYVLDASNTGLGDNLLVNSDMELDSDWADYASPDTNEISTEQVYSGTYSRKLVGSSGKGITQTVTGLTAGGSYLMEAYVYPNGTSVELQSDNGAVTHTVTPNEWNKISMYINQPDTSGIFRVRSHNSTTTYIDNFKLYPVNDKHHATTVFFGDEMINVGGNATKNRDMSGANDWLVYDTGGGSGTASINVNTDVSGEMEVNTTTDNEIEGAYLHYDKIETPVVGRSYRIQADLDQTDSEAAMSINFRFAGSGATAVTALDGSPSDGTIDTTKQTYYADIVCSNAAQHLRIENTSSTAHVFTVDNVSVKEIGTAIGWTDADQQLDIPQTALQSYNQLAWFDGNEDRITVTQFDFTTGQTMNMWLFSNDSSPYRSIFGNNTTENYMRFKNGDEAGAFEFEPDNNTVYNLDVGSTVLPEGEWYMLTFVWNADRTMDAYKNGELIGSSSATEDTTDGKTMKVARFGHGYSSGDDVDFNGAMTEISHYTDLLTQAEINDLYNDGKAKDAREASGNGGLSGYWKNNGLATWTDLQGSNNGAVTCSQTIIQQAGVDASRDCQGFLMNRKKDTNALNLCTNLIASGIDNGPHVDVQGPIELGTTPFSMTMWLKKYRDWNEQWILSQYVSDSTRWYLRANNSNPPRFQFYARAGSSDTSINVTDGSFDLDANGLETWIHLGVTTNRSNSFKWYINGSLAETDTSLGAQGSQSPDDNLSNGANLTIGWNEDTNFDDHHFDGEIDDVMIYTNKEMSAAEVKRNYNAGKRSHK